jgi:uncharacterized zinc-type alcohol dehydrogenase-like protein
MTATYGMPDRISGETTQGGYSKHIVVREEFVLRLPEKLDLAKAAPILCAGITTYSPLRTEYLGSECLILSWIEGLLNKIKLTAPMIVSFC